MKDICELTELSRGERIDIKSIHLEKHESTKIQNCSVWGMLPLGLYSIRWNEEWLSSVTLNTSLKTVNEK